MADIATTTQELVRTITLTGIGDIPINEINFDTLTKDQHVELSRQVMNDRMLARQLFSYHPQSAGDLLSAMKVGRQLAAPAESRGTKKREKVGDTPSQKKRKMLQKEAQREIGKATSTTCLFFTKNGRIKTIPIPSTDSEFFERTMLAGGIKYDMITPHLSIAYSTMGRKRENPLIVDHLRHYGLSYLSDIREECIIYSMSRNVTLDSLLM